MASYDEQRAKILRNRTFNEDTRRDRLSALDREHPDGWMESATTWEEARDRLAAAYQAGEIGDAERDRRQAGMDARWPDHSWLHARSGTYAEFVRQAATDYQEGRVDRDEFDRRIRLIDETFAPEA